MSTRRSEPSWRADRRRFRIVVKFAIPPSGMGRAIDALHVWLEARLGRGCYAIHPDSWDGYDSAAAVLLDDAAAVEAVVAWLEAHVPTVVRIVR